jgi:CheY-like chemotaxis protein
MPLQGTARNIAEGLAMTTPHLTNPSERRARILMAEDDEDDRRFAHDALCEAHPMHQLHFVHDGADLMDYLRHHGSYAAGDSVAPRPAIILLDLNMPKMDGREALSEIKQDPQLCQIPVVVLTTSNAEDDIRRSYELGANSFITKPVTFEGLVRVMRDWARYWFDVVQLPATAPV